MLLKLFMRVMVIVASLLLKLHETQASFAKKRCQETCGNVTFSYPFGIGSGCYLNESFEVLCDESEQNRPPLRFANNQQFPISEISMESIRVVYESTETCIASKSISLGELLILGQHFFFSQDQNLYVLVGCNVSASFLVANQWRTPGVQCSSLCTDRKIPVIESAASCTGLSGCCKNSIPAENITSFRFMIGNDNTNDSCAHAFIAEKNAQISFGKPHLQFHVVLNWVVALDTCHQASQRGDSLCGKNSDCINSTKGLGYNCRCKQGYNGNPYLPYGCQAGGETCVSSTGNNDCISPHSHKSILVSVTVVFGVGGLGFGAIGYWAYIRFQRTKNNRNKKRLFKENGGYLLKKHISDNKSSVMKIKVYTAKEMKKATENFSQRRILGKGGQGTVYKGMLPDKTTVAIKRSNVVDQVEIFVNEIFILAQINHRNIVKLLGCCLEYEVPLLVYEYLTNNTLSQHLHDEVELSLFSWKDRIRIAKEVAGALAYLHSYTSPSILHRDIKPSNILLDENYKAVVSDFGLARSVPLSRTHVTTQVEGTFGYLDPEYFQSGQFTAKSDVYSFGAVLIELLTRKKCITSTEFGEGMVSKFKYLMKHNRVIEILDKEVMQEAIMDDVFLVANLAKKCIKRKGQKRPSMKEVVTELDKLSRTSIPMKSQSMMEGELERKECNK